MRYICLATLLLLLSACQRPKPVPNLDNIWDTITPVLWYDLDNTHIKDTVIPDPFPHVTYMRSHIGVPTKDTINMWLATVGLPPGNPFCSAAASHALEVSGAVQPVVRSGLARNFVYQTPKHIQVSASKVLRGEVVMPAGSMVVYQRGNTIYGHNGFITLDWSGADGMYISANTSAPGSQGSEFSGGGVWEKPATIRPGAAFRITDFIYILYK